MHCSLGLVVAVMQAAEGALRQVGLHRSAGDFEMLLRTFLTVQRRSADAASAAHTPSVPTRVPRPRLLRRVPG